jgi:hypothetical protein
VLQGGLKSFLDKLLADLNAGSSGQSFAAAVSTSTASSLVCINSIDYDPGSDPNTATPFVQVGSARYNRAGPGQIQAVVLNRSNLQPIANNSYADNSSGRSALSSYLSTLNSSQLVVVTGGKYFAYTADTTGLSTILGKIGASSLFISPSPGAQTYSVIGVPGMAYGKADQKSWDSLPGLIRRSNCPDLVDTDVVGRTLSQRIRQNRRAATDHLGPRSAFWFIRIQGSIESPRIPKRVN